MNHINAQAFLNLPAQRKKLAYDQASGGQAGQSVIVEKDFWVSWLLALLFSQPELAPHLVFKGGTSLSKVFGVIDRFSEDIDLCLVPEFVGASAQDFDALASRTRRDAAVLDMQRLCGDKVQAVMQPLLEAQISEAIGTPPADSNGVAAWLRFEVDTDARSPVLYFRYPSVHTDGFAYIRREVKLELGTLTDQQPTGQYPVQPILATVFPQVFTDWQCRVTALELERTFWEKATILHAEFHRPAALPTPDRYARHFADMARLLEHPRGPEYLADAAQCARVVLWKSRVFARSWARYDIALPGSFRLAPAPERMAALANDYSVMRQMFLTEPPPFDAVVATLRDAENVLNGDKTA
jgi:Nucleotidyl transferase AbiEii toxin, Type IV TA system